MDPIIGEIKMFCGNYAPVDWMFCHGQELPVNQYQALYSIIGTTYGGSSTTFKLPDLRGRFPLGAGAGPGLTPRVLGGNVGGAETVTLSANQIPAHTHTATVTVNAGTDANLSNVATGKVLSSEVKGGGVPPLMYTDAANATQLRADAATATVAPNAGGGQAHNNMPPFLNINFIIAVIGIYPQRP